MKIKSYGMSCFLITSDDGTRIITDPFIADLNILYSEIKEKADIVTISCGHYSHCFVCTIKGEPYIYKGPEPAEIKGIKFRGIATRHLEMKENKPVNPGQNVIICFEVDGIKICHLGALGHGLSEEQIEQIGEVDMLLIPINGRSTIPLDIADKVITQIKPRITFPMNYKSERCTFTGWASAEEFTKGKKNVTLMDPIIGSSEMEFSPETLPEENSIIVLKPVY